MTVPKAEVKGKERCEEEMGKKKICPQRVAEEQAAIGFARATDFLCLEDGELTIRSTRELKKSDRAAIASMERTSSGVKLKLYDKMKALELLGKYYGLFDGKSEEEKGKENNLLEAILAATREDVSTVDLPEVQQTADDRDDLVEPAGITAL